MPSIQAVARDLQKLKHCNSNTFSVNYLETTKAAQFLTNYGIVILKDFQAVRHSWTYQQIRTIADFSADLDPNINRSDIFKLARKKHSFRLHRGIKDNIDKGMTDVFNPIVSKCPQLNSTIRHCENIFTPILFKLAETQRLSLSFSHTNLYLYRNVRTPRCLHIDSFSKQIKVFLTLSPVDTISQGPFCYVPKSNNNKILHILTLLINNVFGSDLGNHPKTDSTLVNANQALPLLVPCNTLFICMQNGVHGDLPCLTDFSRFSYVWNYSLK